MGFDFDKVRYLGIRLGLGWIEDGMGKRLRVKGKERDFDSEGKERGGEGVELWRWERGKSEVWARAWVIIDSSLA